jgi:hypothetical protein
LHRNPKAWPKLNLMRSECKAARVVNAVKGLITWHGGARPSRQAAITNNLGIPVRLEESRLAGTDAPYQFCGWTDTLNRLPVKTRESQKVKTGT